MNIPASRRREFHENEVTLIKEAVLASGVSISLEWFPHSVQFDGSVEIQPALFDCREVLNTACWIVTRSPKLELTPACSCGSLVREARNGVYGSLKPAAASAIAEIVRARVLAQLPDSPDTVPNARTPEQPAAPCNDFITHSIHT